MKYEDALKQKIEFESLIGTKNSKGFTIGAIIVVPSNEKDRRDFFNTCVLDYDFDSAIMPYKGSEVEVWALDLDYLKKANIVFYSKL